MSFTNEIALFLSFKWKRLSFISTYSLVYKEEQEGTYLFIYCRFQL